MRRHQTGLTLIEVMIVPAMIVLIFCAAQFALIYSAKSDLNYATFQAARIGAMNHAQLKDIRRGLIRAMSPMFSPADAGDSQMNQSAHEVDTFVVITRTSPDLNALEHLSDLAPAHQLSLRVQYCMPLIVPLADQLLSLVSNFKLARTAKNVSESEANFHNYAAICGQRNGFVISAQASVPMQSTALLDARL